MIGPPGAQTPWGEFTQGRFIGRILPPSSNGTSRAEISVEAADARTRWGNCSGLAVSMRATPVEGETNLLKGNLKLLASHIETRWATVEDASFNAEWLHALTNAIPIEGKGELISATVMSKWGNLKDLRLIGNLRTPPSELLPPKENSWAGSNQIQPYFLDVQTSIGELDSTGLKAEKVVFSGNWQAPQLTVTNLHATLYQGELSAEANLDVATRQLKASLTSDVDPHKVEAALTQGARDWLQQFSWNSAPKLQGQIAVILPPWQEQEPNWRSEVQPTLFIDGRFQLADGGAYRGVPVSAAESHLNYSNMVWSLPDLKATRPDGILEAAHLSDDKSKNFFWRIHSTMPPDIIRPLLNTNETHALDFMTFSQPPNINAEIRGRWHKPEELGAKGSLALTNFAFRGQRADYITAAFEYTNLTVKVINPRAEVGTQQVSAASLLVDIPARKIYLSNGFGFIDPALITRAIGPHVHQIIEPYQFLKPPIAHVNGVIPMKDETDADLFFELDGGPFHWWKFNLNHVVGTLHWAGSA